MLSRDDSLDRAIHRTAWALLGTLTVVMFVPSLAMRGMTWDGVLYATISRNIADGTCDAWHPMVTATFMRSFHEHPPLAFWLEAVFFRILGDHFWVERLYSVCTGLITGIILLAIWQQVLPRAPRAAASAWLPALLWLSCCYWSYRHNILENTLGIFTALSVYASLRALAGPRGWAAWAALAGTAITAALLAKGPVGLFPAVTPVIAWLTLGRTASAAFGKIDLRKAAAVQSCLAAGCAVSLALVLLPAASREYLETYLQQQVLASVLGRREGAHHLWGHLSIVVLLAKSLQWAIVFTLAARWAPRLSSEEIADRESEQVGASWFFLLTALSASLPLLACPKQHGHYTAPSWPFYAFALAIWCLPSVWSWLPRLAWLAERRPQTWARCGMASVTAGVMLYAIINYGAAFRDHSIIKTSNQVAAAVGPHAIVAVMPDSWHRLPDYEQLELHAYLYRDHSVSIWAEEPDDMPIHLRLTPPAAFMSVSYDQIVTDSGFECYPLIRGGTLTANRPGRLR